MVSKCKYAIIVLLTVIFTTLLLYPRSLSTLVEKELNHPFCIEKIEYSTYNSTPILNSVQYCIEIGSVEYEELMNLLHVQKYRFSLKTILYTLNSGGRSNVMEYIYILRVGEEPLIIYDSGLVCYKNIFYQMISVDTNKLPDYIDSLFQ